MALSKEDMLKQCGHRLQIIGVGQSLRAAQSEDLDNAYTQVHARLDAKSLASWTTSDDIPDEFVNPVVALICKERLDTYGVDIERRNQILTDAGTAEFDIGDLLSNQPIGQTKIEYF